MQFGDRISARSPQVIARRRANYLRHLTTLSLNTKGDLYRYFGGDVFHDGQLRIHDINLGLRRVQMSIENVYALDQVCNHLIKAGADFRNRLDRSDFVTEVVFEGIDRLAVRLHEPLREALYYCSEIQVCKNVFSLRFFLVPVRQRRGELRIDFSELRVQDISKRLLKYGLTRAQAKRALTFM